MLLINQDTVPTTFPNWVEEQRRIDREPSAKKRLALAIGLAKPVFDLLAAMRLDLNCCRYEVLLLRKAQHSQNCLGHSNSEAKPLRALPL
jgi:hypothetical protein